jgi:hypothetical protein
LDCISFIKAIFGDDEAIKNGLENFTLKLIDNAVKRVGWEPSQDEGFLSGLLRKKLLISAVANNHPK